MNGMNVMRKKIGSIEYTGLSPEEIRRMSKIKVITADTYDDEGYPIERGLMDPHMGVIEPGIRCKTCGCKVDECHGHFGHIEFARPVVHVEFKEAIELFLQLTCSHCGRLLLDEAQIEKVKDDIKHNIGFGNERLLYRYLKSLAKIITKKNTSVRDDKLTPHITVTGSTNICPHCQTEQAKILLVKPTTFREADSNNKLTPQVLRERLERIPDNDLAVLGLNPKKFRPEWMILTVLPVPPVTVRPSITPESGEKSEDDLTHKLVDIIRINERLRENRDAGSPQLILEDLWELLQYHVTTYFDNQTSGIPPARHRAGRPLKTLNQRLKGKEGRFRSNLSGKRVNFSARTVISPDPLLSINDVGVPEFAARELSVPLRINQNNLLRCRAFIRRGTSPVIIEDKEQAQMLRDAGYQSVDVDIEEDPETGVRRNEIYEGYEDVFTEDELKEMHTIFRGSDVAEFEKYHEAVKLEKKYVFGVNYLFRPDGRKIRVLKDSVAMEQAKMVDVDYTIWRQLVNGDVVLFNRQPSLHRMSMMAHRVKVMGGHTFRFNLCVCPPYNADFDGDEMNLHVLQGEEARAEARILMQVQENILSPRYGGPIIGGIHDHISGSYFLTHKNPRFTKQEAMNILTKLDDIMIPEAHVDEDGNEYWTGKELFSIVLPKGNMCEGLSPKDACSRCKKKGECHGLNIKFKAKICQHCAGGCQKENCPHDAYVVIRNGELVCGTIDVNGIGNSKGQILEHITRDCGSDRGAQFINQVTRIALGAIMNFGFSTGIDDEDIPEEAKMEIKDFCEEKIETVRKLVETYEEGMLEQDPGRSLEETLEVRAKKELEAARDRTGEIAGDHLGRTNPAVIMAKTGARGNMLNLSQMAGCVGQQTVRGDRLSRGYGKRTLPHFKKGDLGAYAKGFVIHSYKAGLSPTEFFFHAMGGREGLVDTAVRTSRSGYLQRKLITAFIDLKLTPDLSVRDSDDTIVQFKYGEDGADPAKSVRGSFIDLDDLFTEVFGDDADQYLKLETRDVGGDYGAEEHEGMDIEEDEEGEEIEIDTDFGEGGE